MSEFYIVPINEKYYSESIAIIPSRGYTTFESEVRIPSFEDKVVQGVFKEILEAIYEPKFKEFSFGFRPNKSCHDAIQRVNRHIMADKVNYIVDADIKGFFDNIDHEWMIQFLEHDIADKNFIRYIKTVSDRRSHGRREAAGNRSGNSAGRSDVASAGKCVPALHLRHVV